jgi:uncharacterized protein YnzC (UPF0291/DUF896 family)
MSSTDFFDDDLLKRPPPPGGAPAEPGPGESRPGASRDLNLARMSRHRDQLEGQVAQTIKEIESLRQKQEDFENEKRRLEELRRKQEEYLRGKRDILQRLNQSLLALEREEVRATQLSELLAGTRKSFRDMLENVERIDESQWGDDNLHEDLSKAQDLIASVRVECEKALARLETFLPAHGPSEPSAGKRVDSPDGSRAPSFGYLVLAGLAVGIPVSFLVGGVTLLVYWIVKGAGF